jgi:glutathione peroxidase
MPANAYDFSFTSIDGHPLPLKVFEGKAVLVVNTASECGLTPQYAGLQRLHDRFKAAGFTVLGVPSNNFGGQEPGSAAEIQAFCETNYRIGFPLTEKVDVVGAGAHPSYRWAVATLGAEAQPKWNFHKFLLERDGRLVGFFASALAPEAPEVVGAVEAVLPA